MDAALGDALTPSAQDREITATVQHERGRLLEFIRRRIGDAAEAEDVLQDTLYELVVAYRMTQPVEHAGAWLARVARNRIIDRFRRKRPELLADQARARGENDEDGAFEDLLPAEDDGPESAVMRELLLEEIQIGLGELPPEQREVFLAHEIDGLSFRELSAHSGVSVNTLLSRKRYAVLYLQERLRAAWDDWLLT
jgi:RNA polymerase sigma factor (sigma-70 family)